MKSFLFSLLASLSVIFGANARTDAFYTSQGSIFAPPQLPPQIDALVWTNRDTFSVDVFPAAFYETQNTVRYVNRGSMDAFPGFRFETINDLGERSAAGDVINRGQITARDALHSASTSGILSDPFHELYGGHISIWATNVTSPGFITGAFAGDISIRGENVDLSRGGIGNSVIDTSSFFTVANDVIFFPEIGFEDDWWRYGTADISFDAMAGEEAIEEMTAAGPTPAVTGFGGAFFDVTTSGGDSFGSVGGGDFRTFVRKQQVDTNYQVFDVAFVRVPDPNILVEVAWVPGSNPTLPPVGTTFIRIISLETNAILGLPATNEMTFVDSYATRPLDTLLQNIVSEATFSPTNLFAVRNFGPVFGAEGTNDTFYASGGTNTFTYWIDDQVFTNYMQMTNVFQEDVGYVTWAGNIDWLPSDPIGQPPPSPSRASWTNAAGRVTINANNLNLSRTRIQGQGVVAITAKNLVSSDRAVIDAPILSLDLSSAKNDLLVDNVASGMARHMGGSFAMFSTTFSNTFTFSFTNATQDTNQAPTTTDTTYNVIFHVTVLDTTFQTLRPQVVEDVRLTSDLVTVSDPLNVFRHLLVDANQLVVNSQFGRGGSLDVNINSNNLPRLQVLEVTPEGAFTTPGLMEVGDDLRSLERISLQGGGGISASAVRLAAGTIDNAGTITADGGQLDLRAGLLSGDGGTFDGEFGLSLQAEEVAVSGATFTSNGDIDLSLTKANFGPAAGSSEIHVTDGLTLVKVPAEGDFGSARIVCDPPDFWETSIVWSGEDRGITAAPFQGNAAIGELELRSQRLSAVAIRGSGEKNAMYVRLLNVSDEALANFEDYLFVYPNVTLYFSEVSANLSPAVLDGYVTPTGGKLVFVPSDSALVARVEVSSDGSQVSVVWKAKPGVTYQVQSRPVSGGAWSNHQALKNTESTVQSLRFQEAVSSATAGTLYRVVLVQ